MSEQISIGGEYVDVPSWALDATMQQILQMLGQIKGLSAAQTAAIASNLQSTATNTAGTNQSVTQMQSAMLASLNAISGQFNQQNQRSVTGQPAVNSLGGSYASGLVSANNDMVNNSLMMQGWNGLLNIGGNGLKKFGLNTDSTSLKLLGLGVVAAGLAAGALTTIGYKLVEQSNMYRELYASGLLYKESADGMPTSFTKITNAALAAGVPINEFAETLRKHARVINKDGIEKFASMSREVSKYADIYGMTNQESSEYLAEYMEQQRASNTLSTMSRDQVLAGAKKQIETAMEFSRTMGIATKEMLKTKSELADSVNMKTALMSVREDIRGPMGDILKDIGSTLNTASGTESFNNLFLKMVEKGNLAMDSEEYRALSVTQSGQQLNDILMTMAEQIKAGTITTAEAQEQMKELGPLMGDLGKVMSSEGLIDSYGKTLTSFKDMAVGAATYSEQLKNANKAPKTNEEAAKEVTNLASGIKYFRDILNQVIGGMWESTAFVESIQNGLSRFSAYWEGGGQEQTIKVLQRLAVVIVDHLPIVIDAIVSVADWLTGFFGDVEEPNTENVNAFNQFTNSFLGTVLNWYAVFKVSMFGMKTIIGDIFTTGGKGLRDALSSAWGLFKGVFTGAFSTMLSGFFSGNLLTTMLRGIVAPFTLAISSAIGMFDGIMNFDISNVLGSIVNIFLSAGQGLVEGVLAIPAFIENVLAFAWENIKSILSGNGAVSWEESKKNNPSSVEKLTNLIVESTFERSREIVGVKTNKQRAEESLVAEKQKEMSQVATPSTTQPQQTADAANTAAEKEKQQKPQDGPVAKAEKERTDKINKENAANQRDLLGHMERTANATEKMHEALIELRQTLKQNPQ